MLPGPIKNGVPHVGYNVRTSVVNATTVVSNPSNAEKRNTGVYKDFADFDSSGRGLASDGLSRTGRLRPACDCDFGSGFISGYHVGCAAAGNCADV